MHFYLKPSIQFRALLGALCSLAFLGVYSANTLPRFLQIILFFFIVSYAIKLYWFEERYPGRIVVMHYLHSNFWDIQNAEGQWLRVQLMPMATFTPAFSALEFRVLQDEWDSNRALRVLLWADSLQGDLEQRRLLRRTLGAAQE